MIKPRPLQAPVAGGFTVDDFTVDEQAGTVTCPAGHTVGLSRTRIATFGVTCRDCPLRERCTTCKTGRKLVLHERDDLLRAARADWTADTGLREDYMRYRPNVERAVAQVATWRGTAAQAPLPRGGQEPRLAQAPHRRPQPAQPDRQRADPPRRRLGAGYLTGQAGRRQAGIGGRWQAPAAWQWPLPGRVRPGQAPPAATAAGHRLHGQPRETAYFSGLLAAQRRRTMSRCQRKTVSGVISSRSAWRCAFGITVSRAASSARSAQSRFGRRGCRRCRTASWWRRIKISAVFHASSRRDSRSHEAIRVIRRKKSRRHMSGDHHGWTARRATLLVTATEDILGTHSRVVARAASTAEGRLLRGMDMCLAVARFRPANCSSAG